MQGSHGDITGTSKSEGRLRERQNNGRRPNNRYKNNTVALNWTQSDPAVDTYLFRAFLSNSDTGILSSAQQIADSSGSSRPLSMFSFLLLPHPRSPEMSVFPIGVACWSLGLLECLLGESDTRCTLSVMKIPLTSANASATYVRIALPGIPAA